MTSFCGQKDVLVTIFGQFERIYGHKMTSYFEIEVRYDKKFFSTLSTLTTESSHIYFFGVKTKLTGSKGHISVQIDQKQSKRRIFGHKMT